MSSTEPPCGTGSGPLSGVDSPKRALNNVAAAVIVFHPDPRQLLGLVDTLLPEVDRIYLFLNSPLEAGLDAALRERPRIEFLEARSNLGIGVGLNIAALAAALRGLDSIVFFDQDSRPRPGTIQALGQAQTDLIAAGAKPAVVAPMLIAETGAASKAPTYRFASRAPARGGLRAVEFVPTSGSLVRIDVLRALGFFRADFFIDGIDLEWSFRAWSRGYSCWIHADHPMPHSVGTGVIAWRWLGFRMPRQRPFRMYCMVRNLIFGLRFAHIPFGWKARQVAYLPVQLAAYALHHRLDTGVLKLLAASIVDGLRGRLGVPRTALMQVGADQPPSRRG